MIVRRAAVLVWLITSMVAPLPLRLAAAQKPDTPVLNTLLERTGRYVIGFQGEFSRVVGSERYRQEVHTPRGGDMVDLESEVFFVALADRRTWLTVRHVLTVNGRSVATRDESVVQLLMERGATTRLRELADASARYNIGSIQRNFNDPTLALLFLSPEMQWRFRFSAKGTETLGGAPMHRVAYEEREGPTIVRDARTRRNAPSSGYFLIDDDGLVWQSQLVVRDANRTMSTIKVTYGLDPKLTIMVPLLMEEEYRTSREPIGSGELITGRAAYSDYRRFETGGRVLP